MCIPVHAHSICQRVNDNGGYETDRCQIFSTEQPYAHKDYTITRVLVANSLSLILTAKLHISYVVNSHTQNMYMYRESEQNQDALEN